MDEKKDEGQRIELPICPNYSKSESWTAAMDRVLKSLNISEFDWNKVPKIEENRVKDIFSIYYRKKEEYYRGQIKDIRPHGRGVLVSTRIGKVYEGEWRGGRLNGFGRVKMKSRVLSKRIIQMKHCLKVN